MSWSLNGTVLVACNCDYGRPRNYNARPTTGDCEGGWTWVVDKGVHDGVQLDGLALAVFADWPGAIHEGGGVAVAYIDERANEEQRAALTKLVRGEVGGPWAIVINTYALDGPHAVRFDGRVEDHIERCLHMGERCDDLTPDVLDSGERQRTLVAPDKPTHHVGLATWTKRGPRATGALRPDQGIDDGAALDQQGMHLRVDLVDAVAQLRQRPHIAFAGIGHLVFGLSRRLAGRPATRRSRAINRQAGAGNQRKH